MLLILARLNASESRDDALLAITNAITPRQNFQ